MEEEKETPPRHEPEADGPASSGENVQYQNENVQFLDAIEPDAQEKHSSSRRSSRTLKYSARYQEFRKSLGLIGLIGNISNDVHNLLAWTVVFSIGTLDEFKANEL